MIQQVNRENRTRGKYISYFPFPYYRLGVDYMPRPKYKPGDTVYFVESSIFVKRATVLKYSGGMYTIKFDNGGGMRIKENRLCDTEKEALFMASVNKIDRSKPY